jgi:ribose transport system substrate-binding protein
VAPTRRQVIGVAGLASVELLTGCRGSSSPAPERTLRPYVRDTGAPSPTGLPSRVAWASTADSEFFRALGGGMRQAAADRGVEFVTATSGNDPRRHAEDMSGFLRRGVGALAMQPLNPDADTPVRRDALSRGVCVQGIITAPSTTQVVASQYAIGHLQGKAAADYVTAHLGGNAQVLYFNLDTVSPALRQRHRGVLDGLKMGGGGIQVVGDLTVADISTRSGYNTMLSALSAHEGINVVMGGDTIVVGAHEALRKAGKLRDDMYLSGVDGDSEALALVKAGGAYKLSIAFAWRLMGYGLGQFGADWIEGRRVPRMVVAKGVPLDSANAVSTFQAANADPARVFADVTAYQRYLPLLGSVSHASRTQWEAAVDPPAGTG